MSLAIQNFLRGFLLTTPAESSTRNLFRAIATDIHFWIPLSVLLGGVFLLDKLR